MRKLIALFVAVALLVPAVALTAVTNSDWPNFFKDPAHTNYQSNAEIPDVLQRDWVYYPEKGNIYSHAAVGTKLLLSTSQGMIIALDQKSGQELWTYDIGEEGMTQIGTISGKLMFICMPSDMDGSDAKDREEGGGNGGPGGRGGGRHPMSVNPVIDDAEVSTIIGMVSLENGAEIYKEVIKEPETISAGLVGDKYIYLSYSRVNEEGMMDSSRIVCVNPEDQSEMWSVDYDMSIQNVLTMGDGQLFGSGVKAYIDASNPMNSKIIESGLVAISADGKINWEKKVDKGENVGMISYDNDTIYYQMMIVPENFSMRTLPSSFIIAADADNGEEKWRFGLKEFEYKDEKISELVTYACPAITNYGIVIQCFMNHTVCLDKDGGSIKWVNETPGGMAFTCMQFACAKNKVISTRGTKISLADAHTGEIVFIDDTKMSGALPIRGQMPTMAFPIIANDKVFVSGDRMICYGEKVIGLYSDPPEIKINQIYPDEIKTRNIRVFYNDTGEINGTLTPSDDWISLSSTEYITLSQTYEATLSAEGLEPGVHTGTIDVESSVGNLSIPVEMNVVAKPPIKLDIKLDDMTITNEESFKVEGETVPGASLDVNGRPITVKTDGTFSDVIPIDEGHNELKFHADDGKGNIADVMKIVILDTRKPIIRTTLKEGQKILNLPYEFQGATERGARLMVNEEPIEVSDNGEFTVILSELEDGDYTVNMIAKDKAGNVFKLDRNIIIDATKIPLELKLDAPDFAGSQSNTYILKGKTSPNHTVVAFIGEAPAGYTQANEEGIFELEITVKEDGEYHIKVVASSSAGKSSDPVMFTLIIDSQLPVIECVIPELVSESPIVLEGTTEPMTKVFINDQETSVDTEGNFSFELELNPGLNAVTIKAVDMMGNESTIEGYIKLKIIETVRLKLWVNEPKFVINNEPADDLDPMPTTKSPPLPAELAGNSYMPVRAVFEALGATVEWINDDRRVDVTLGDTFLQLWVDNIPTAKINGVEKTIIGADGETVLYPTIVNGRTMLPLRFACESLGADVNWIAEESAIEIVYPSEQ